MEVEKIYFDMDGVLADFNKSLWEMCHLKAMDQNGESNPEEDARMWEAIRNTDHFYDRLDLIPGAKELFDKIWEKYGDRCEILTGLPRAERGLVTAEEDKRSWTRRLLSEDVKLHAVCRKDKQNYCKGKEYILIDDREKNIREWQEKGGTGILFKSAEETLKELKQLEIL